MIDILNTKILIFGHFESHLSVIHTSCKIQRNEIKSFVKKIIRFQHLTGLDSAAFIA